MTERESFDWAQDERGQMAVAFAALLAREAFSTPATILALFGYPELAARVRREPALIEGLVR